MSLDSMKEIFDRMERSGQDFWEVVLTDDGLHDNVGYNPFAGRRLKGWPETVLRRGDTILADGTLKAAPGSGRLQLRGCAPSMQPTGRLSPELDPGSNFGAQLL